MATTGRGAGEKLGSTGGRQSGNVSAIPVLRDQMEPLPPSPNEAKLDSRVALAAQSLLLASAAAAVLFCGVHRQGSMGIFLCGAGVALLIFPPRRATSWLLWTLAAALAGCAALALLPKTLFAAQVWRTLLDASPVLPACGSLSTVPAETVFWLAILAATLLAGLFSLGHPVRSRPLMGLALAAGLACAVYAGTAALSASAGWKTPFDSGADFGFFPNRNHAATLLITGCLSALGVVTAGFRNRLFVTAWLAGVAVGVCAWALIMASPSRAGILVLAPGLLVWVLGLGRSGRSWPVVVSFAALCAAAAIFLIGSESLVKKRLGALAAVPQAVVSSTGNSTTVDPRVMIFQDTLHIIRDHPWTGTGLGSFRYVYPHYARASLRDAGAIHPESDWLMLAAEAGPAAVVLLLAIAAVLLAGLRTMVTHPFWPLRWGLVCAALAALFHGLVDVPLHRIELGWWVLVLAGLGLGIPQGTGGKLSRRVQHIFFIVGGAAMVFLGIRLVQAEWLQGPALPPFAAAEAQANVLNLSRKGLASQAWKAAGEGIRRSPMTRELYYQRGVLALAFEGTDREVDSCFETERLLDPKWPEIPVKQGQAWLRIDPARTSELWWKAVDRQARIEVAEGRPSPSAGLNLYTRLLAEAAGQPAVLSAMEPQAGRPPDFTLAWLAAAPDALGCLRRMAGDEAFLSSLGAPQRDRFLAVWFQRGDRDQLLAFLDARPDWAPGIWLTRMRCDLAAGMHQQAVGELCARYDVSLDLPEPGAQAAAGPDLPDSPTDAFFYLWAKQNEVGARRILQEANEKNPAVMAEIFRLRSAVAARSGNWPLAFAELLSHLRSTGKGPLP